MFERDLTSALGVLLTSPRLLALFERDRAAAAHAVSLRECDRELFLDLRPEDLRHQAQALVDKRAHEASRWLPWTCAAIGPHWPRLFAEFAWGHWPTGYQRHAADALAFCEHLRASGAAPFNHAERNHLAFLLSGRRLACHWVTDFPIRAKAKPALQILWRGRRGVRQLGISLLVL